MKRSPAISFAIANLMNCICRSSRTRQALDDIFSHFLSISKAKFSIARSAAGSARCRYFFVRIWAIRDRKTSCRGQTISTASCQPTKAGTISSIGDPSSWMTHRSKTSSNKITLLGCVATPSVGRVRRAVTGLSFPSRAGGTRRFFLMGELA